MATIHAENYYGFRYAQPIIDSLTAASSSEASTLAGSPAAPAPTATPLLEHGDVRGQVLPVISKFF
ncbi:hypothetical protein [Paraburkholderia atlantica]|uniref:hypothetical protein n=1 Tax=Paraburkholderia atlantica TaxID=2654982 RepID=UPI0016226D24|nr:hypothetical protein [Paraburkholderia atlantica]MBB5421747.1 hypothetical protein [Paraburkholderia atlantica]